MIYTRQRRWWKNNSLCLTLFSFQDACIRVRKRDWSYSLRCSVFFFCKNQTKTWQTIILWLSSFLCLHNKKHTNGFIWFWACCCCCLSSSPPLRFISLHFICIFFINLFCSFDCSFVLEMDNISCLCFSVSDPPQCYPPVPQTHTHQSLCSTHSFSFKTKKNQANEWRSRCPP